MSHEDELKKVGQGLKAWQDKIDEILYGPGYRTIYAQEANMPEQETAAETAKALMDKLVDAVCAAIDYGVHVPLRTQVVLDYEGYDVDIVVTMRKKVPMEATL